MRRIRNQWWWPVTVAALCAWSVSWMKQRKQLREEQESVRNSIRRLDAYQKMYAALFWGDKKKETSSSFVDIRERLREKGARTISIYGCGFLGKCLYESLRETGITVVGFVDKYSDDTEIDGIPVYAIDSLENLPKTDLIIVMPVHLYHAILCELYCRGRNEAVVSLLELLEK